MKWFQLILAVVFCSFMASTAYAGKTAQPLVKNVPLQEIKSGSAPLTGPKPAIKPKQIKPLSKTLKIQSFLTKLKKARSMEDVAKAFKRSKFNQGELKQLELEIQKGVYMDKLERLKTLSAKKTKPGKPQKSQRKRPSLQKAKADLKRIQDRKISRLNQQAAGIVAGLNRPSGAMASASVSSRRVAVPQMMAAGIAAPTSAVDIREINPRHGIIGQRLTIRGTGFGSRQGEATLVVGEPGSADRQAFVCPIQSWNSRSIVVTIPLDCESMVALEEERLGGIGSEFAWIHINPSGDDPGGFENMEVSLDRNRFAPQIESLNPGNDISPGQVLIIRGRNLHIGRFRYAVVFNFGRERIELDPDRYEAGFLQVRMPADIEGIFQTPGTVDVTNMTGLTDSRDITFVPLEEIVEIVSEELKAHCNPSRPRIFCFVGNAHRHTLHDWTLTNGWVVEDSWLETYEHGINSGAYYIHEPSPGSTMASSRLEVWADAYSRVTTIEHLRVKGPKGTFRQSH